jgi:hypothetical protein
VVEKKEKIVELFVVNGVGLFGRPMRKGAKTGLFMLLGGCGGCYYGRNTGYTGLDCGSHFSEKR